MKVEVKDPITARKVQKADREKLRRDQLNEQFLELANTLGTTIPFFWSKSCSVYQIS